VTKWVGNWEDHANGGEIFSHNHPFFGGPTQQKAPQVFQLRGFSLLSRQSGGGSRGEIFYQAGSLAA
jgi:hypothetical protein